MVTARNGRDLISEYFDVFNGEVRQFLDPLSFDHYDLRGSHVHVNSRVKRLQEKTDDDEDDFEIDEFDDMDGVYGTEDHNSGNERGEDPNGMGSYLGSYWSAAEKSIFFHCLARYSIHRLDEWRERLASKSKFEILIYYEVLNRNLTQLKRSDMKNFGGILSRMELPIAYEVDEFFVSFEETMSRTIRMELEPLPLPEDAKDEQDCLISFDNWSKRWRPLYSKANIEEIAPVSKDPLQFSQKAKDFLVECCRDYTRRLVTCTILTDFEKNSIYKDAIFKKNVDDIPDGDDIVVSRSPQTKICPHIVNKDHVSRAISLFKFEGHRVPTLGDTVLRTIDKFELRHDNEGKLFKNNKITMSLLPTLLHNATSPMTFFQDPRTKNSSEDDLDESDLSIAKKLYRLSGGKLKKRRKLSETDLDQFVEDDKLNRLDNLLELQLCDWETDKMDSQDLRRSQAYQHTLLAYFSDTNREDQQIIQLEPENPLHNESAHPIIHKLPASMINRFLHSNT